MKKCKHPNCNSCANQSTKDYVAGSGYCLESKSGFLVVSRKNISLQDFVSEVGCASYKPKNGKSGNPPLYMQNASEAYDKFLTIASALPKNERKKLHDMLKKAFAGCEDTCKRKHCPLDECCCEDN
jgi:hypothetical protein